VTPARALAVLAVAAGALVPAAAHAAETCHKAPWESYYPYVCTDPDYPGCVAYGSLGEEAMFHVGDGCPWPYGTG
jgi:hypothetical protein